MMDFERLLACLVAALAMNELIHIALETGGVRMKVRVLKNNLLWHGLLFVVVSGALFGLFITLDLTIQTLLFVAIVVMIIVFAYTTIALDAYYTQIGQLSRKTKKD